MEPHHRNLDDNNKFNVFLLVMGQEPNSNLLKHKGVFIDPCIQEKTEQTRLFLGLKNSWSQASGAVSISRLCLSLCQLISFSFRFLHLVGSTAYCQLPKSFTVTHCTGHCSWPTPEVNTVGEFFSCLAQATHLMHLLLFAKGLSLIVE